MATSSSSDEKMADRWTAVEAEVRAVLARGASGEGPLDTYETILREQRALLRADASIGGGEERAQVMAHLACTAPNTDHQELALEILAGAELENERDAIHAINRLCAHPDPDLRARAIGCAGYLRRAGRASIEPAITRASEVFADERTQRFVRAFLRENRHLGIPLPADAMLEREQTRMFLERPKIEPAETMDQVTVSTVFGPNKTTPSPTHHTRRSHGKD